MKILHELNQLDFGGVEKVIESLIKHDQENEHHILAYKDGEFRERLENAGAKIHIIAEGMEFNPDVIHVHCGGEKSQIAEDLQGSRPVIETIHSPIRSPLPDFCVTQRVGVTQTVSDMNKDCITIYNGIDFYGMKEMVVYEPEELKQQIGIEACQFVVGRLGRLGRDKGVEEYLLTCHYLQQAGHNIVPLIVGGEARGFGGKYLAKLKLMAESLPVHNVKWIGNVDNISDYYNIMDCFLYPSSTEGFGLVFIEALNHGLPIVTYNTPVNREVITKQFGIFCRQNIDSLYNAVRDLISIKNYTPISLFSNRCTEYAQTFSVDKMVTSYQELYKKVS